MHWLHHDGITHNGYDFDGTLYLNFPSRLLAGVPWIYYFWLLLIKTPIPILVAVVVGCIMLLRERRTLASCFLLAFGVLQLTGLSVSGAKWVRYSLPVLPFLFLAAGYAVHTTWNRVTKKKISLAFAGLAAATLFVFPLLDLRWWSPYTSFYLNAIGGGQKNVARYFPQDEVSEFDTREVAQQVCSSAPAGIRLATARPMTMTYYVENCGRADIEVVALYERHYVPREGDMIVLEPSRRFFETQKFFDVLGRSGMSRSEVRVGPILASTIYSIDSSRPKTRGQEQWTLTQFQKSPSELETNTHMPGFESMSTGVAFLHLPWRSK